MSTQDYLKNVIKYQSVHQLIAFITIIIVHKCVTYQKPKNLAKNLRYRIGQTEGKIKLLTSITCWVFREVVSVIEEQLYGTNYQII